MSDSAATRELQAAVEALAAEMAPAVVADARADAEARARSILSKEITRALLSSSEGILVPPTQRQEEPRREPPPPAETSPVPSSLARESALGLYLYGIVYANVRIAGDLPGVDARHPVFLLEGNELAAIVSPVSLAEFGEEQLRENLNEVAWLETAARAHEAVLEAVLESAVVVPTRLCTIFRDEKQVREMMSRERPALVEALERLEGKSEWGVKVFADPGALEEAAIERAGERSESEPLSPGAAYMNQRRREARAREEADEIADEWTRQLHDRLSGAAAEALLNPLQRRELSGHQGEMLLNGVYLVENGEVESFEELVLALDVEYRPRGIEIDLTGPWPAYNFVKTSIESAR